jgi:hypothetical protein
MTAAVFLRQKFRLTIGDLFVVKRGLATGSSDFFIVSEDRAKELEVPDSMLTPIGAEAFVSVCVS